MTEKSLLRIGGEIPVAPELLDLPPSSSWKPPTFNRKTEIWLDTGRSALALALDAIIKQGATRKAWLPSYLCGSIADAFLAKGFSVNYYPVKADLTMEAPPRRIQAGDAFLFIHYFGIKNTSALEWLSASGGGFWVIEDAVQAPFTKGVGEAGDFVFTSLRKFLPQPDGALLSGNHPVEGGIDAPSESFVSKKFIGKLLRGFSGNDEAFLRLLEDSEKELKDIRPRGISTLSRFIMERTDFESVSNRRRSNYLCLAELISGISGVSPLFPALPEGAIPLGLPVLAKERDRLRKRLAERNIFCSVHWPLEHEDSPETASAHKLGSMILTLPVNQDYNKESMERVQKAIREFYGSG